MRTIDIVRHSRIERVVQESSNIKSFYFVDEQSLSARPGQFVMVWLPGAGEFPMSLSLPSKSGFSGIGVKAMGVGTRALYECNVEDSLGIRGPYGSHFDIDSLRKKKRPRVLLVGGGTGMVPIVVLAKALFESGIDTRLVIGARTHIELPFLQVSKKILGKENVFPTTDDGSFGFGGFAHEQVGELLKLDRYDEIFSCGPEKMMLRVFEIAKKRRIPVQFSLERIMKCGIAICGSCTIGELVLCRDGPVLTTDQLENIRNEFGTMHRDKSGKLCSI